jgi:[acyl-carrier-protein] S-malonyltransferase
MLALMRMDTAQAEQLAEASGTVIANRNCPGQLVISGSREAIALAEERVQNYSGARAVPLSVSGAFHSPLMQPAVEPMKEVLDKVRFQDTSCPVISNTKARPMTRALEIKNELVDQLCESVHWQESVTYMHDQGVDTFIEIGPGRVLGGLIRRTVPNVAILHVEDFLQEGEGEKIDSRR